MKSVNINIIFPFLLSFTTLSSQVIYMEQKNGSVYFNDTTYQKLSEDILSIFLYYGTRGLAPSPPQYPENVLTESIGIKQCTREHYLKINQWIKDEEILEDFSHCQKKATPHTTYYSYLELLQKEDTILVKYRSHLHHQEKRSPWTLSGTGTFLKSKNEIHFLGEEEKLEHRSK